MIFVFFKCNFIFVALTQDIILKSIYAYEFEFEYVYICKCVYMYLHVCIYIYECTCIYVYICVCICSYFNGTYILKTSLSDIFIF